MSSRRSDGSHEIDYEIFGVDIQYVEIELDPDETVIAEPGAMMFMEDDINFQAKMGDGSEPSWRLLRKLKSAALRSAVDESVFIAHFTNTASANKRRVAFGAPFPGEIVPVDLSETGGGILVQRNSFLCAALGTKLKVDFNRGLGAGTFGGEGFVLMHLSGDGMAFVHAGGTIAEKYLEDETLRIETGAVVAFETHLKYSISLAGGLKSMMFGGEDMFVTTLKGTGYVWLQSLPFNRLADQVVVRVMTRLNDGD